MSCASKTRASNSCWAKPSSRRKRWESWQRETSKPGAQARSCEPPCRPGVFSASCVGALPGCPGQRIAAPARRAGQKRCVIMRLGSDGTQMR